MFQKNFLGVKYLTQNFQKKRHPAVLSQKRPSQTQKSFKLPPKHPLHPLSPAPPAPPRVSPPASLKQT